MVSKPCPPRRPRASRAPLAALAAVLTVASAPAHALDPVTGLAVIGIAGATYGFYTMKTPSPVNPDSPAVIRNSWATARQACERDLPPPATAPKDAASAGAAICTRLRAQGKHLQCVADKMMASSQTGQFPADSITNWARCTRDLARVLNEGYYLSNAELDRRVDYCNAERAATPVLPNYPPARPIVPIPAFLHLPDALAQMLPHTNKPPESPPPAASRIMSEDYNLQSGNGYDNLRNCVQLVSATEAAETAPLKSPAIPAVIPDTKQPAAPQSAPAPARRNATRPAKAAAATPKAGTPAAAAETAQTGNVSNR